MSLRYTETAYGTCKFYGKDEYIGRSLYAYGEFSGEECLKIVELAPRGKMFIDIGANIGVMSMALGFNGFNGIAFEPQPALHDLLKFNVRDFNISCLNWAVGSSNTTVKMPKLRYEDRMNFGGISVGMKSPLGSYDVTQVTLDNCALENIGFIKIDVEGYELEVLKGAVETIRKFRPIMYIEDDRLEKSFNLRKFIKELKYDIEEHRPPLFRPNNFKNNNVNIWDRNYVSHNIICRPC